MEYRGDRVEYWIRVGATLLTAIEASLQPRTRVDAGDRVALSFMEQALHLLASAPGQ